MTDQSPSILVSVLRMDADSEEHIRQAMLRVSRLLKRDVADISPHISLIPTDFGDERSLLDRIQQLTASTPAFDVVLSHVGWFPGGVAFLGATPTRFLLAFHQQCHDLSEASPQAQWIDLYQPGAWIPHCTVAMGVPDQLRADAMETVFDSLELPIRATCVSVELIQMKRHSTRSVGICKLLGE